MSEVESAKGSGDCLPKLNYQNSSNAKATSSIVRLNSTVDNTVAEVNTGELKSKQVMNLVQLCPYVLHF